ncbi:hypothetical protein RHSIM_Rhsim11G0164200 [Rhododendron simsii]|uniref:O-acyltransferase WSD1 C-terminal domain-containing protein n=1 Tax=Rhododendron simsii TaxID=118357 RepID=A0A834G911_RHOSS|nr:hypothetical protein RHSIM_Rhsim11G0164200 [Rhododendron simsii]
MNGYDHKLSDMMKGNAGIRRGNKFGALLLPVYYHQGGADPLQLQACLTTGLYAITMHMVSYAGRAEMQILVAKDIIPDPQVLAKCFEDGLHQMKEAATKE